MYYVCPTHGICYGCPDCNLTSGKQEYKYRCCCGGEFNEAVYKWISDEIYEIGQPTIVVANRGQGHFAYVCPFCGGLMKGLS